MTLRHVGSCCIIVLAGLALVLFSGVIVLLFPSAYRIYAALGLAILYVAGAAVLWFRIKDRLQSAPFAETVNQMRKDLDFLSPPK